jgi:anaerobic selenocysteine-containing dehydrogenase
MTSVRSEGQFNTIIYEQEDRWVVLMNATDMQREGLQQNDYVNLFS